MTRALSALVMAAVLLVPACAGNPSPATTTVAAAALPSAEEALVSAFLPLEDHSRSLPTATPPGPPSW